MRNLFQRTNRAGGASIGANPLRAGMHVHRAVCLIWLVGLLAKTAAAPLGLAPVMLLAVGVFITMALYVGACSDRPPKRRDIRHADPLWKPAAVRRS